MGKPMRILIMAMAVASGDAFIVSPKAQLAARRTLPHARAMPIVAGHSKFEDEGKLYTSVCPHACVMSHLAYGPREPVDLLPPPTHHAPSPPGSSRACAAPSCHPHLMPLLFTPSPSTLNSPHRFRLGVPASAPAGRANCEPFGRI